MDYKELVKSLRYCAEFDCTPDCPRAGIGKGCIRGLKQEAADAIEALQGQIDGWITQERKALLKSIPKWISVKERLPEEHVRVFIVNDDGKMMVGERAENDWWYQYFPYDEDRWEESECGVITHWMPPPEPPILALNSDKGKT